MARQWIKCGRLSTASTGGLCPLPRRPKLQGGRNKGRVVECYGIRMIDVLDKCDMTYIYIYIYVYILIMYINYYSLSLSSVGYTSVRAHTQCQLYSCTQNAVSAAFSIFPGLPGGLERSTPGISSPCRAVSQQSCDAQEYLGKLTKGRM